MTVLTDACISSSSPALGGSRGLIRWLTCNNPFYVLSAMLVCLGLWVSFGGQAEPAQTWALAAGLSSYTLLLAVTACLLVRLLGVWDDVRTVLLLSVLMFLATSVTFDQVLAVAPSRGSACFVGGLAFAVAVSEGMLRGCRLALPLAFRIPYLLILAHFFLYPVALVPLLDQPRSAGLELGALRVLTGGRTGRAVAAAGRSPGPEPRPGQRQSLALGLVPLDTLWRARLRRHGTLGAAVLVHAPPPA